MEEYFSQIFPMLGVRVICVMENYDSKDVVESEIISLENIMNSYYVKDLKRKIESSVRTIQKSGKIHSKNTPFGYICEDKNEGWKVDPEAAEIVKLIFAEAASGKSTGAIAKVLNQKGCKTPDKRKFKKGAEGSKNDPVIVETNVWDSHKVKRTLKNEQYTGVRIAHQTKTNKAGKQVKTAPEEQYRFENDHEALVSPEDFQLAQQALMVQGKKPNRKESGFLFSGLLRCGKCHRTMSYSKNMSEVFCRRERSLGDSFEGPALVEDVKAKIWEALKSKAVLAIRLLEEPVEKPDVENAEAEIRKLKDALMDHYEEFADGKITKEAIMTRPSQLDETESERRK